MNKNILKLSSLILVVVTSFCFAYFSNRTNAADECDPFDPDCYDACPGQAGIQSDPSECDPCLGSNPPESCDVCPDDDGVQTDPTQCKCHPTDSDPDACKIFFCGDVASDPPFPFQPLSQTGCQQANQVLIDQGYSCVRDDSYCHYRDVTFCGDDQANNATTQSSCEDTNPNHTCVRDDSTCEYGTVCNWSSNKDIACPSGAQYLIPITGSYTYDPRTEQCTTPRPIDPLLIAIMTKSYCSSLVPPDTGECTTPECTNVDWCPTIDGVQTDPTDCPDICENIPGVQYEFDGLKDSDGNCDVCPNTDGLQISESECMDVCPNIDGTQLIPTYDGLSNDTPPLCDVCPQAGIQTDSTDCPDVCPNISGIQFVVPEGMAITDGGNCQNDDMCPNISGIQSEIPDNHVLSTDGDCVCGDGLVCAPTDGFCGIATTKKYLNSRDISSDQACGYTSSILDVTYDSVNREFNWMCNGIDGGTDASCSAVYGCNAGFKVCYGACIPEGEVCENVLHTISFTQFKATPMVKKGGSCTLSWTPSASVSTITHCILSTQDGPVSGLNPFDLVDNADTGYTAPTSHTDTNVTSDKIYTMKCWEGSVTPTTVFETTSSSCRLNLKYNEFN